MFEIGCGPLYELFKVLFLAIHGWARLGDGSGGFGWHWSVGIKVQAEYGAPIDKDGDLLALCCVSVVRSPVERS